LQSPAPWRVSTALYTAQCAQPRAATVQAMDPATQSHFPPTQPLLVMGAYAVVFGVVAIRLFRWE